MCAKSVRMSESFWIERYSKIYVLVVSDEVSMGVND